MAHIYLRFCEHGTDITSLAQSCSQCYGSARDKVKRVFCEHRTDISINRGDCSKCSESDYRRISLEDPDKANRKLEQESELRIFSYVNLHKKKNRDEESRQLWETGDPFMKRLAESLEFKRKVKKTFVIILILIPFIIIFGGIALIILLGLGLI